MIRNTVEWISFNIGILISIFQPPQEISTALPVMFFIHGGSFLAGSGAKWLYSPDLLINKNIVLVTINYRLHVLGKRKIKYSSITR